jgi:hypothetical protein
MKFSTQIKVISTALAAAAFAAPIAHGDSDGTLLSRASQQAAPSTDAGIVSDGTLLSEAAGLAGHQSSYGSYLRLKSGEGFSFKAPSYWSTIQTPHVRINRSLEVPPQYLAGGAVLRTAGVSMNRSLGVPPQYLGSRSEQVSTASNGFDWADAGIGAAFVAGLATLCLGGFAAVRRRQGLAHVDV